MMLAGDEMGHTQGGNNNAYCQDSELSWLDWELSRGRPAALSSFVSRLIAIRKAASDLFAVAISFRAAASGALRTSSGSPLTVMR